MVCAFLTLVVIVAGIGALAWLVLQRLKENPQAARVLLEEVVTPMLFGKPEEEPEKEPEVKPEVKRTEGTLI